MRLSCLRRLPSLALLVLLSAFGAVAEAQEDPDEQSNAPVVAVADAAFKGWAIRGRPIWVVVALENRAEERTILLSVGGAAGKRERTIDLAAGARKQVGLLVPTNSIGDVRVVVFDETGKERLFSTTVRSRQRDRGETVIAYMGRRPPGLRAPEERDGGIDRFDLPWEEQRKHTARMTPRLLPESWRAYTGVEALYWPQPQWDRITAPQARALEGWILNGGHLVVAEDDGWRNLATHSMAKWLPAVPTGVEVIEDPATISDLLGPSTSLGRAISSDEPMTALPKTLALMTATPRPGAEPFVNYSDQSTLGWTWAVGDGRVSLLRTRVNRTGRTPTYDDWSSWMVGKTRPRLSENYGSLPVVDEPKLDIHPGALLCLLFLYVLIIGPIDFLVLRHFRRLELTLITYPAAIVLFGTMAWIGMLLSVDSSTFLTRTELVHWHLGPEAIEDRPEFGLPAAGTQVRYVLGGYFPTARQRVTIRAPEGFELGSVGPGNAWQNVTGEIIFRGPPQVAETTASAYALIGVELTQVVDGANQAPIKIVGSSPPVVHNQLAEALTHCWMRDGNRVTTTLFELQPGESRPIELIDRNPDTGAGSLYSVSGDHSPRHNKITALSQELEQASTQDARGEVICVAATGTDVEFEGLEAEDNANHRLLRFVF